MCAPPQAVLAIYSINATTTSSTTMVTTTDYSCNPTISANSSTIIYITANATRPANGTGPDGCPAAVVAAFSTDGTVAVCKVIQGAGYSRPPPMPPLPQLPENQGLVIESGTELGTAELVAVTTTTLLLGPWPFCACCIWWCCCLCRRRRKKQKPACLREDVQEGRLVTVNVIKRVCWPFSCTCVCSSCSCHLTSPPHRITFLMCGRTTPYVCLIHIGRGTSSRSTMSCGRSASHQGCMCW